MTFDIDTNSIVTVSARDKGTGRSQKITITNVARSDILKGRASDQPFPIAIYHEPPAQTPPGGLPPEPANKTSQEEPKGGKRTKK